MSREPMIGDVVCPECGGSASATPAGVPPLEPAHRQGCRAGIRASIGRKVAEILEAA